MAIKVNGTTVIDDSRNLSNVGGLKTVNGTSLVGSGNISAGASTTFGAVGTYAWGRTGATTSYGYGDTASSFYAASSYGGQSGSLYATNNFSNTNSISLQSGTWRHMGNAQVNQYNNAWGLGLWVRIS